MITPKTVLNRMLKLVDHLETLPPEEFDMGHWVHTSIKPRDRMLSRPPCGTSACIAGHGTAVFRSLKLEIPAGCSIGTVIHTETGSIGGGALVAAIGASDDLALAGSIDRLCYGPVMTPEQASAKLLGIAEDYAADNDLVITKVTA